MLMYCALSGLCGLWWVVFVVCFHRAMPYAWVFLVGGFRNEGLRGAFFVKNITPPHVGVAAREMLCLIMILFVYSAAGLAVN
jgi:hypothetical protein